jgi:hypothetical protein
MSNIIRSNPQKINKKLISLKSAPYRMIIEPGLSLSRRFRMAYVNQSGWIGLKSICICLGIYLFAVFLYARCWGYGFVDFDDTIYVLNNKRVTSGISIENIWWGLTSRAHQNWMPVAWWSFQFDCMLWGVNPSAYHAMSAFWHGIAALTLAWAVREFTDSDELAMIVALIFAAHPMQVEAVAWISSRKHILAAAGAFAALACWCRWWKSGRLGWLTAAFGMWFFSLMAKQTFVGWPLVVALITLLLLPKRKRPLGVMVTIGGLAVVVSCLAAALATWALRADTASSLAINSYNGISLNAVVSVFQCIKGFLIPIGFNYLHTSSDSSIFFVSLVLISIFAWFSWFCWRERSQKPILCVGWAWFVISYAPASGIVVFGPQSWAERFSYSSSPGLCLIISSLVASYISNVHRIVPSDGRQSRYLAAVLGVIIAVLSVLTIRQQGFWRDSKTLFERALAIDPKNSLARFHLAGWYERNGKEAQAFEQYSLSVELSPLFLPARYNMACGLMSRRRFREARNAVAPVAESLPHWAEAQLVFANASLETGDTVAALRGYEAAARLNPALTMAAKNAAILREQIQTRN